MSSNALTTTEPRALAAMEAHAAYIEERRDLIRTKIAYQEISDAEFDFFLEVCKLRVLNPLANQINCIKRAGKASFEPTIDGFRLVAARTGQFAGAEPYVFGYDEHGQLDSATCTVYKMVEGQRCAFSYTVYWEERCPRDRDGTLRPINNWVTMPRNMLGKCAETAVLRQAFPEECGGLYAAEEMEQADIPQRIERPVRAAVTPLREESPADAWEPPARTYTRSAPPQRPRTNTGMGAGFKTPQLIERLNAEYGYTLAEDTPLYKVRTAVEEKYGEEIPPDKYDADGKPVFYPSTVWNHAKKQETELAAV